MIIDLHRQGLSLSAIARRTGLDRITVRKYVKRGLEAPAYEAIPVKEPIIASWRHYLRDRVDEAVPELSARRRLWEIRGLGHPGSKLW